MMEDEPEIGDTLLEKKENCCKKHLMTIIIFLFAIIIIISTVIIVIILNGKDKKEGEGEGEKEEDKPYKYGLNITELRRRTSKDYLGTIYLLEENATEYESLDENDKKALYHLVKAAQYLENIEYQIDDHHNLPFKKFLEEEIAKGKEEAKLTKILFDGQKGINGLDTLSNEVNLAKGHKIMPGMGVYPEDLTKEEFQKILIKMLKENKTEEVKNITNQRSIVVRDGEYLKAIDYVDYFREDFEHMAEEFEKAAELSTNKDFNDYLKSQAKALRIADPKLDAEADKKWADLQDTPLELTLTRESYADEITPSFIENEELVKLLNESGITPVGKDTLGLRVGIVNKEGTNFLLKIKEYLPELAKQMPYQDQYEQKISDDGEVKQTMVDVDLIILTGDVGAYRGSITLAENLPNDDKLSLSMGGGRRNVYHRQIRGGPVNETRLQEYLNLMLDPEQHQYFDYEADHWFTIGHENTHSLGPIMTENNLGKYDHIIEENKADMGGLAFVDFLTEKGYYTEEQRKIILVSVVLEFFLYTKPLMSEAHNVRAVMQNYYLFQKGAYYLTENNTIHVNIDKVVSAANDMLTEIIEVQLANDFQKAEDYVNKYFVWTNEMQIIGDKLSKRTNNKLNCIVKNELADKILSQNQN